MIREAVAWTLARWSAPIGLGMISFIDPKNVEPRMIRGRPTWAHSYFQAGFKHVGYTKGGLWALQMLPDEMPPVAADAICEEPQ